ncbi:hypothetical protein HCN44_010715 [Aphidius gifuensis]|uniref:protein-tyrosine-phosphatase n=1 Tax=Aphidius gifuensis TaxID=684658 RepID=A0A834XVE4_APHGI|nr:hypothetical protein HCN44_010715 [Aphidius gifuensis]
MDKVNYSDNFQLHKKKTSEVVNLKRKQTNVHNEDIADVIQQHEPPHIDNNIVPSIDKINSDTSRFDDSLSNKRLSSCGYDSMDDGFNELIDIDNFMENTNTYPINLNNLISGDIVKDISLERGASTTPKALRIKTKKVGPSLSLKNDCDDNDNNDTICTPPLSKIRSCSLISPNSNSSIASDTLEKLIHGEFEDGIASYQIVDCRYPYEYEAGHIKGALNLYTKKLIEQHLMKPVDKKPVIKPDKNKHHILIFHCEFSWKRGPNLSCYLRNIDRKLNKEHYPATRHLCSPQGYRPINHPDHDADLRKFRSISKSWQEILIKDDKDSGILEDIKSQEDDELKNNEDELKMNEKKLNSDDLSTKEIELLIQKITDDLVMFENKARSKFKKLKRSSTSLSASQDENKNVVNIFSSETDTEWSNEEDDETLSTNINQL